MLNRINNNINKESFFIRFRGKPQETRLELIDKSCPWMNAYHFCASARYRPRRKADKWEHGFIRGLPMP